MSDVSLFDIYSLESANPPHFMSTIGEDQVTPPQQLSGFMKSLWPVFTGWNLIRLGDQSDGGYLVPRCLDGLEACFSPGVDNQFTLERHLADIFGIKVFACDPNNLTVPIGNEKITFENFGIGSILSPKVKTLEEWTREKGFSEESLLMLSMDIEGHEYHALSAITLNCLRSFRIVTLEIHYLWCIHDFKCFLELNKFMGPFLKYFDIVHMHPNTESGYSFKGINTRLYTCLELTFLNKCMRKHDPIPVACLPHKLDKANKKGSVPLQYGIFKGVY